MGKEGEEDRLKNSKKLDPYDDLDGAKIANTIYLGRFWP